MCSVYVLASGPGKPNFDFWQVQRRKAADFATKDHERRDEWRGGGCGRNFVALAKSVTSPVPRPINVFQFGHTMSGGMRLNVSQTGG